MTKAKQQILLNLKKAQSHLAKVQQMVEADVYCIDIMQQNLAVIGLLKSAHEKLMENHFNTCFRTALQARNEKRKKEMVNEILKVSKIYNK